MKTIRWGILGCGNVTETKSGPAYQQTEGFEVIAVMRRNAEKVKDYANRHGIKKYYTNADQLINDPEVDAIYIATPPDSHKEYALKVASAGKICCIEKPMAPNYKDCEAITSAFKAKNIPLFVAYYRRSLPRFLQIQHWLKAEEIGVVRHINWNFCKPTSQEDIAGTYNWRTNAEIAPGGYFDDLASHGLDLFVFLLGNIDKAQGICANQQGLYKAFDTISASWQHKNNITGSGSWNFGSYKYEDKVTIYGSKREIKFSVFENNPIILITDSTKENLVIEHPKHIQKFHVQDMKKELVNGDFKHPSSGETASHTTWVMDQILGN